ncbi:MAG: low molecular weight protein arginine phosphatase [Clostridiales bacterium]|jgi:protein-tyrosine-phosphatase|nr:low molecular weight protein arginine phosphatase [Clostridiales bacterium]
MVDYKTLIFTCTGNTCRSPMAEAIYKNLDKVSDRKVLSRGLVVLFNEPINPKAETVLNMHELELNNHIAKGLKSSDIDGQTLILTMTESQKKKVLQDFPEVEDVYTIKEFAGEIGDVVDPYGGTLVDYEECFTELARLVKKTFYKLNSDN